MCGALYVAMVISVAPVPTYDFSGYLLPHLATTHTLAWWSQSGRAPD
jgi:hypothetical protein